MNEAYSRQVALVLEPFVLKSMGMCENSSDVPYELKKRALKSKLSLYSDWGMGGPGTPVASGMRTQMSRLRPLLARASQLDWLSEKDPPARENRTSRAFCSF